MYVQMAQAAIAVGMSLADSYVGGKNRESENIVNRSNVAADNLMRASNNKLSAAAGSLRRYNQSVSNQRALTQTGQAQQAAIVNYERHRDAAASGNFEAQVQMAEQAGQQAAASAASGITGGVADMVNATSSLRNARLQQIILDRTTASESDAVRQQGNIMRAGYEGIDSTGFVDNIDHSISTFTAQASGSNVFGDVLAGLSKNPKNTADVLSSATAAKGSFSWGSPITDSSQVGYGVY
jgi:hypothetical protein